MLLYLTTPTSFVQVCNLKWLGFRVSFAIVNQADQLYPHAVSLMESIRTYELTCHVRRYATFVLLLGYCHVLCLYVSIHYINFPYYPLPPIDF